MYFEIKIQFPDGYEKKFLEISKFLQRRIQKFHKLFKKNIFLNY